MRVTNTPTLVRGGLLVGTLSMLLLTACSGSTEATTDPGSDEPSAVTTSAPEVTAETTGPVPDSAADQTLPAGLTLADVFDPIATEPTEAGPRPLLAWEAVEGATLYQVVVLGADGEPYWAWSGTETMINVGGNAEPDAIGAWVHESMTWTVSALSADAKVLGLSAAAGLEP